MVANHTSIHGLNEANMAVAERMSGRLARERTRPLFVMTLALTKWGFKHEQKPDTFFKRSLCPWAQAPSKLGVRLARTAASPSA